MASSEDPTGAYVNTAGGDIVKAWVIKGGESAAGSVIGSNKNSVSGRKGEEKKKENA